MKHIESIGSLSRDEIFGVFELAFKIKKEPQKYSDLLKGKTMALWFEKPSLRTRASFEAGMTQLGGHAIYLDKKTLHSKAEVADEIKCLDKYVDIIVSRVFSQETILEMCESSRVPVINALSDKYHPCQALADLMTIYETFKDPQAITIAYVGDGNNVCNSLIAVSKKVEIKINVATPRELKPIEEPSFWSEDPKEAVKDASVVYTDTWVSMGFEEKKDELEAMLSPYQVNKSLIGDKYFMHCLPAIRGKEVTDEVIDSQKSLVFQQAENRLHVQKALILKVLGIE
jgi:ornithine carbamoyltransferase